VKDEVHIFDSCASGLWELTWHARTITFIGAGGKTSTLSRLATELASLGETVVATTTTKVFPLPFPGVWESPLAAPPAGLGNPCFWYAGVEAGSGKWVGPARSVVEKAIAGSVTLYRRREELTGDDPFPTGNSSGPIWLIEGDGAKGRKLKCWAEHEPQIPANTQCAVLLMDGTLWGQAPDQADIHRVERCPELCQRPFDVAAFGSYLEGSPVYDPAYGHLAWVVLLNLFGTAAGRKDEILTQLRSISLPRTGEPSHLRLAAGDVRCGRIRWLDLW